MDTISTESEKIARDASGIKNAAVLRQKLGPGSLALTGVAIILWLILGGVLTWLVKDFARTLEPEVPIVQPGVILSLFVLLAYVIGRFSWNSFQRAKTQ